MSEDDSNSAQASEYDQTIDHLESQIASLRRTCASTRSQPAEQARHPKMIYLQEILAEAQHFVQQLRDIK